MEQTRSRQPLELRQRVDSADGRGEVTIRGDTEVANRIDGDVTVTSGDVLVTGVITGSLYVVGGHVRVVGSVGGSVENLGGVVDILGVVEGEVLGPPPATRVSESAVVGKTTNDVPNSSALPPAGSERYDSAGRWRIGSGLLGAAAAVALVGVIVFGGNDTPSFDQGGLAVVEVDRSAAELLDVAGAVEFRAPEPVEPLTADELESEVVRTNSLLGDLPISPRTNDVGDPGAWLVPPSVGEGCLPWEQLVNESLELVTVALEPCEVHGRWVDALSADEFADADGVIVQPLVPVENVVQSGGAAWDEITMRAYLTDNTSPETLQVMSERRVVERRGQGPDRWRPTNEAVWCSYGTDWISVKTRWGLTITSAEAQALQEMLDTCANTGSRGPNPDHARADRPVAAIGLAEDSGFTNQPESEESTSTFFACDASYPGLCIPPPPPVLTCAQVGVVGFAVEGADPHGFDSDGDGLGCTGE